VELHPGRLDAGPVLMGRELLFTVQREEFDFQTFRAGGSGGQNQNKRDTAVRIIHRASGARGESREHRTQGQNRKAAMRRLVQDPRWRVWLAEQVRLHLGLASVEDQVDRLMQPENLKIEHRDQGRWAAVGER